MKARFYAVFLTITSIFAFSFYANAQSPFESDSLSVLWEQLGGPPAYVSKYAEGNGIMYAASEEALFSSIDSGLTWTYNQALGRIRIKRLFANDHVVIVIAQEPLNLEPGQQFSTIEIHQVLRSTDHGQSWQKVLALIQEPETNYPNQAFEIFALNDSTIAFNYQYYPSSPYSNVYLSKDFGNTWAVSFSGASFLQTTRDTFAFIKTGMGIYTAIGGICSHSSFNNTQEVDLSGTGSDWNNIRQVAYKNGLFYLFQSNKTLWRSPDFGTTWQSELLSFSGFLETVIWADSVFFLTSSTGVYKGSLDTPSSLQKVYNGEQGNSKSIKTFCPTPMGYWANTNLNQTIFSENIGQSWEPRSIGLSSSVGQIDAFCDGLLAQSRGAGIEGGWYLSDNEDENWVLMLEPIFYTADFLGYVFLGEHDGYLFRYNPTKVQRSSDCGQTWENLNVAVSGSPQRIIKHQGKLLLYTLSDKKFWYSDDDGTTWETGEEPDYDIWNMFSAGDYLIADYGNRIYVSDDAGLLWTAHPLSFPMTIFAEGQNLVGYYNPGNSSVAKIYRSTDLGITWDTTANIPFMNWKKLRLFYTGGLFYLHFDDKLFISANLGENWTEIQHLPFSSRAFRFGLYSNYDTLVPQAIRYFTDKGFLYAGTEAQGIWRTPLDSILLKLTNTSSVTILPPAAKEAWQIEPNPAANEVWLRSKAIGPDQRAVVRILISDTSGKIWRTWDNFEATDSAAFKLNLDGMPNGIYFIEIQTPQSRATVKLLKM